MRWLKFFLSLAGTIGVIWALQHPTPTTPFKAGPFFSPFSGFWKNAEAITSKHDSVSLRLPGIQNPVEVIIDERRIPHIFARNIEDAVYAQGYVTAKDRLWQMEFQTHAAAGRLTELIGRGPGDAVLQMDRTNRRKGMVWGAKRSLKMVMENPETGKLMKAYSDGINAYISSLNPKDYPIEYKLMNYAPESWTPLKTALLLKYMANSLAGRASDMSNTHAYALWGKETFESLYPEWPKVESPIIPEKNLRPYQIRRRNGWGYEADAQPLVPSGYIPDAIIADTAMAPQDPTIGSNNWAISGNKSLTGKPILAGDPHLGLSLPSIWYEIQLKTPELNVYGVSLPGAPGVTIGFNDSIAWSMTNAGRDVLDFYKIEFQTSERKAYKFKDNWEPVEMVLDTFHVKGGPAFIDTLLFTQHGPVMYDRNFGDYPYPLAARWIAHDESNEMLTFYKLNQAKNYDEYLDAISYYVCPAQNFVFASVSGDIAIWQQGKFANLWPEQGKYIMDGNDSTHLWQSYIPQSHNPHVLNPPRNFVSSANQQPTDQTYPYYYYGRYEGHRNRRINQLLSETDTLGMYDMKRFQLDNYAVMAEDILPFLLETLKSADLNENELEIANMLERWDYNYDPDQVAPTIYQNWWDALSQEIWKDEIENEEAALRFPSLTTTIGILLENPDFAFYDNITTPEKETREQLIVKAFRAALTKLQNKMGEDHSSWTWSSFKATRINHLSRLAPFSRTDIPIGGNRGILNATSSTHGPSWRMVVSLEEPIEAHVIYPGGQSGNPGSPYYDNFIDKWAQGNYDVAWFMQHVRDSQQEPAITISLIPGQQ